MYCTRSNYLNIPIAQTESLSILFPSQFIEYTEFQNFPPVLTEWPRDLDLRVRCMCKSNMAVDKSEFSFNTAVRDFHVIAECGYHILDSL